jgi:regulator of protease activity HflC (stomatin/prohibitin superfamily)
LKLLKFNSKTGINMEAPIVSIAILAFAIITIFKGVKIVPQQQAWVIERLGKYKSSLQPGLNLIIPFIDRVAYKHSLKEGARDINSQTAITKDNVSVDIDGIIYFKIIDPKQASYGVSDPYFALSQLAQTTMRSEIGKIDLDKTFEERETLNVSIVNALNEASANWGIQCMRYEIKDINPPSSVLKAMEQQVTAERTKRAQILDSEGDRQAKINVAEGDKQQKVLASEAQRIEQINHAEGEAQAIISVAEATAEGIKMIAKSIRENGGEDAVALKLAEQYINAFSKLAKDSNTLIIPSAANDISSTVASALTVFDSIRKGQASGKAELDGIAGSAKPENSPWDKS